MSSKAVLGNGIRLNVTIFKSLIWLIVGIWGLAFITGCGSNSAAVELPKDFICDFIAKHETMVDESLVYYYVREEQPKMAEQIDISCRINKSKGRLEHLENATFDFSELRIELVDKKEMYVNDEPAVFIKVAIKGNYKMKLSEETRKINANEIIILQMARNEWKVTETKNPWS